MDFYDVAIRKPGVNLEGALPGQIEQLLGRRAVANGLASPGVVSGACPFAAPEVAL
jgi:hypothetical protein